MTKKEAIKLVSTAATKDKKGIKKQGLHLKFLGSGCFRAVFLIEECPSLVVKINMENGLQYHSRKEVRNIKKLSSYRVFKTHVPKIHFFDKRSGLMVTDRYQKKFDSHWEEIEAHSKLISKMLRHITGVKLVDVAGNHLNKNGTYMFGDLGY